MDIRPIRSEADHAEALVEIERLLDAAPGSPEADRLDILATLVERCEEERWPVAAGDPVEIIRFVMEQRGEGQSDLARIFGSASRASEILNRRRALTLEMVWKLNRAWHIPAELLIRPYDLAA
ncbi:helix-turn-helix domain-containing protein [Xanthobacter tagetidis]|jgi:HTH-type transcriptional regulator/antitoxin HigA|uniref:Transcriptional regulator n=1 Tax=Xanthobacter tagetidis TaxID=60216 RepID=A0A3L7AHZ6_9HYPH|nr:transcriptional regulator [Xanthobacter tagetidis]MBB6306419.1 HTH-type transcriptional regulator/antitoxin HigA [Xanthobacter tagetidis]RLP79674.1 transcriptional regulator [Xanthobacter tagetidis]